MMVGMLQYILRRVKQYDFKYRMNKEDIDQIFDELCKFIWGENYNGNNLRKMNYRNRWNDIDLYNLLCDFRNNIKK